MNNATRWNIQTQKYEPYELPEGATVFHILENMYGQCARCSVVINPTIQEGYRSRQIKDQSDRAYMVCKKCSELERREEEY